MHGSGLTAGTHPVCICVRMLQWMKKKKSTNPFQFFQEYKSQIDQNKTKQLELIIVVLCTLHKYTCFHLFAQGRCLLIDQV